MGPCRIAQRNQSWHLLSDQERADVVQLARQAIALGKDDPDALSWAGQTIAYLTGHHAAAARAIDRALTLNQNSAGAWLVRGWVECWQNRPGLAIQALERAMRLSPLGQEGHGLKTLLACAHLAAGRYEEAMYWADEALYERPEGVPAIRLKAISCGLLGRIEEGKKWLARLLQLTPGATVNRFNIEMSTFMAPEIRAVMADGLRKAGMPEE